MLKNKECIKQITLLNSSYKFLTASLAFFWAIHFVNIGLSGYEIGIILGISTITALFFSIPNGIINDRFQAKNLITIGLIFVSIQHLLASQTSNFFLLAILFFIGGLGNNIFSVSIDSLFLKKIENNDKETKISFFLSRYFWAITIGILISGFVLENIHFTSLLEVFGIGFLILAILSRFLPSTGINKAELKEYKKDIIKKEVLFLILMMFLFAIHFGAENTSYGLFLKNNLQLSLSEVGIYMAGAIAFMGTTSIIVAKKIKKGANLRSVLLTGLFLNGLGHFIMTYENIWISFTARVVHEIGDAIMFVFLYYGISQLFGSKRMGGNSSILATTQISASFIGALAFGPLGENLGYEWPMIVSAITTGIALIIALLNKNIELKKA